MGVYDKVLQAMAHDPAFYAITQGIGVVTGLRDKFLWAGAEVTGLAR
jgi:hypothetical protein